MACVGVDGKGSDSSGIGPSEWGDGAFLKVDPEESGTEMERGF